MSVTNSTTDTSLSPNAQLTAALIASLLTVIAAVTQIIVARIAQAAAAVNHDIIVQTIKETGSQRAASTSPTASADSTNK